MLDSLQKLLKCEISKREKYRQRSRILNFMNMRYDFKVQDKVLHKT